MNGEQPKPSLRPQNDPKRRFKDGEIIVRPAQASDMIKIVRQRLNLVKCYQSDNVIQASLILERFPEEWWSIFENPKTRRSDKVRAEKLAWRWDRVRRHDPDFVWLVAEIKATGEFAGVAGWHKPVKGRFNRNLWLADMPDSRSPLAWSSSGGTDDAKLDAEIRDAWADIDVDGYLSYWAVAEQNRKDIQGNEPHW